MGIEGSCLRLAVLICAMLAAIAVVSLARVVLSSPAAFALRQRFEPPTGMLLSDSVKSSLSLSSLCIVNRTLRQSAGAMHPHAALKAKGTLTSF